jgi:hypothetical protein
MKHKYDKLFVSCIEPRYFDPRDPHALRDAVRYLESIPDAEFVQLTAEAPVRAGNYKLRAPAAIKLKDLKGMTPSDVWAHFDKKVDDQIQYFTNRSAGFVP